MNIYMNAVRDVWITKPSEREKEVEKLRNLQRKEEFLTRTEEWVWSDLQQGQTQLIAWKKNCVARQRLSVHIKGSVQTCRMPVKAVEEGKAQVQKGPWKTHLHHMACLFRSLQFPKLQLEEKLQHYL